MKKSGFKRIICAALCLAMLVGCCFLCACSVSTGSVSKDNTKLKVLYLPLDDRPVNNIQVKLFAESLNIELIMPDEGIYATKLNGSTNESGLQYGDRAAIYQWLQKNVSKCDVVVIYLDQLLSGGLMNSRAMAEMEDVCLADGNSLSEYDLIDFVAELAKDRKVYIIDSLLRLAVSSDYLDFTASESTLSRMFGKVERPVLKDSDLTLENVIANYTLAADESSALDSAGFSESEKEFFAGNSDFSPLARYLKIRERKLRLNAYAVEKLYGKENITYLLGVDDSAKGYNVQGAEYAYLQKLSGGTLESIAAIDCLAEYALSDIFSSTYSSQSVKVSVKYFGDDPDGELNYSTLTISQAVNQMVAACGAVIDDQNPDIEILVDIDSDSEEGQQKAVAKLADAINSNAENHVPTIYLDYASTPHSQLVTMVQPAMLLSAGLHGRGSGCSAIMGISQGIARYKALKMDGYLTDECDAAFLQSLAFAFVKSYYYRSSQKEEVNEYIASLGLNKNNFTSASSKQRQQIDQLLTQKINECAASIFESFGQSKYITSLYEYTEVKAGSFSIKNCTHPWDRVFEFTGEIVVK